MGPASEPPARPAEPVPPEDRTEVTAETERLRLVQQVALGLLLVLVAGLGFRQLYRAADYATRERRQNQRQVILPGPRGVIYDREHRVLAGNRAHLAVGLNLGLLREEFAAELRARRAAALNPAKEEASARFAVVQRRLDRVNALIGRRAQLDPAQLERHFAREPRSPLVVLDDLTAAEATELDGQLEKSGPLQLLRTNQRWYPHGSAAAHVLGRVRRERMRPDARLAEPDRATLSYVDTVGDSGIEKQYDARLRGRPGSAIARVDARGALLDPPLERRDPQPGEDLVLSLDLDLQLAAERTMAATPGIPRGAAVVIAVKTGEILALASKPDFDLNEVSPALTPATKQRIDAEGGWFNRAVQGLYPPGSSFKIFTALAGLRRGTLHPDEVVRCDGFYEVAGHRFPCHHAAGHGDVSLRSALAQSCNVFAYRTGLAAGADALAAEARRFHFAEPTGIDLPAEARRMLVPDPAWKQADGRGSWTAGDTANLSIGQGFLRYSPLQAACAVASLARRETLTVPTLLHQPARRPTGDRPPEPLGLADGDYAALIEGLQAVILTGIGRDAQVPGVSMAGKSGTAQARRKEGMVNIAWFVAFAPVERPEIAVAVALEGDRPGEEFAGAAYAAPVVREIVGAWSDKQARR